MWCLFEPGASTVYIPKDVSLAWLNSVNIVEGAFGGAWLLLQWSDRLPEAQSLECQVNLVPAAKH